MTSTAQPVKIRKPLGDRILTVVCYTIAIVFAICCLIPFIMALSASFTSEVGLARNGFALYPTEFSAQASNLLFPTSRSSSQSSAPSSAWSPQCCWLTRCPPGS